MLASAFLLAVVLGNVSLRYIPVSFAQVMLLRHSHQQIDCSTCQSSPYTRPCAAFLSEARLLGCFP